MPKKTSSLGAILRPWWVRVFGSSGVAASAYQFGCDQFGLPTLPRLWGLTGAYLPWWGWLLVAQGVLVLAIFDYVRRNVGPTQPPATTGAEPSTADAKVVNVEKRLKDAQDEIAKLLERIEALETLPERLHVVEDALSAEAERAVSHRDRLTDFDRRICLAQYKLDDLEFLRMYEATALKSVESARMELKHLVATMDATAESVFGGEPPKWFDPEGAASGEINPHDPNVLLDPNVGAFKRLNDQAILALAKLQINIGVPSNAGQYPFFDPTGAFRGMYQGGDQLLMRLRFDHHLLGNYLREQEAK